MTVTSSRRSADRAESSEVAADTPSRTPTAAAGPLVGSLWFGVVAAATALLVLDRVSPALPVEAARAGAGLITAAFAVALMHRTGDRPVVAGLVGLALGLAAAFVDVPALDAGVALATAVLTGVLAVMVTVPAPGVVRAVREVLVATFISAVGALAVAAYAPDVMALRFRYLAVVVALGVVIMVVSSMGSGLHGVGRRGALALVAGTTILVAAFAYGEALSSWGSPVLVDGITEARSTLRETLYAVPHPIETLLGFPALTWGVFMRARRRQGWWACAFGVAATVSTACALVDPEVEVLRAVLGGAYSLVLGLLLGYLVIRLDLWWTGPRGARARRDEAAHAERLEPGRTRALR